MKPPFPSEASFGSPSGRRPDPHLPPAGQTLGMLLLLVSLGVLFAAALVAYIVAWRHPNLDAGTISLPPLLWGSTGLLLLSSVTMQRAVRADRWGRSRVRTHAVVITALLGLAFLGCQSPSLLRLLGEHTPAAKDHPSLAALIFILIVIHAAHVVGGLVPLGIVTWKALFPRGGVGPLRSCAMYWHFLDGVWLVLFGVLLWTT